jgi:hypothetical protein
MYYSREGETRVSQCSSIIVVENALLEESTGEASFADEGMGE